MKQLIIFAISSLLMACTTKSPEAYQRTDVNAPASKSLIPRINPNFSDSAIFVSIPQACTTKRSFSGGPYCCDPLFPLIYDPISLTDPEPVMTSPRIREYY